nr:MAG TPA: hypothetical protein [Caudoviricetes sp.]
MAFYDISLAVLNLRRNTAIVHNITCIASYLLIDLFYFTLSLSNSFSPQ